MHDLRLPCDQEHMTSDYLDLEWTAADDFVGSLLL